MLATEWWKRRSRTGQCEREIEVVFRGNGFEAAHAADEVIAKGLLDIVGAETDTAAGADGLRW